jgi:hypothetical protein
MYSVARKGHPSSRVLTKCLRKRLDDRVLLYIIRTTNVYLMSACLRSALSGHVTASKITTAYIMYVMLFTHFPGRGKKEPLTVIVNVNPYQKPTEMSPTFAVKGKESGTARVLGSGTSGMCSVTNCCKYRLRAH